MLQRLMDRGLRDSTQALSGVGAWPSPVHPPKMASALTDALIAAGLKTPSPISKLRVIRDFARFPITAAFDHCYNFSLRHSVLQLAPLTIAFVISSFGQSGSFRVGDVLPAWAAGTLDIHQIVAGRGNAAFMMFPDGTTLLLDAGDAGDTEYDRLHSGDADQRPDSSRTPAQWIARYIRHMAGSDARLDYAVITHFHPDHMGIITGSEPLSIQPPRCITGRESVLAGNVAFARNDCSRVGGDSSLPRRPQANAVASNLSRTARYQCDAVPRCDKSCDRRACRSSGLRSRAYRCSG